MSEAAATPSVTPSAPVNTAQVTQTPPPQAPGVPGATSKVETPSPEYYEVKINGQPRKMTLEELKSKAVLGLGAHEKFEQAAQQSKKYIEWKEQAKKDALGALMNPELGLTKEEIKQRFEGWYKENFIDPEMMTAEEKRIRAAENKAKELEAWKQQREEADRQAAEEAAANEMRQTAQKEIIDFLEQSDLPKTRFFANRAIYWKRLNLQKGYDAPNEIIKEQVKSEFQDVIRAFTGNASIEQIVGMLGEDIIRKLRQYDLGVIKKKLGRNTEETPNPIQKTAKNSGKKTMADVDEYFNSLRRSKR